ncbi:MAG: hypothetical protein KC425_26095 [Anaerolineales bacterium]|nr:hypothetical protein [Anaerolineales bacterium]
MTLSTRQWGIVGLTVATAVIHLILAFLSGGTFMIIFILNALGYLALLAALYFLPQFRGQRDMVRWGLLAYTAVTFILYFAFNWPDIWGPLGLIDKAIELVLIILLWMDR